MTTVRVLLVLVAIFLFGVPALAGHGDNPSSKQEAPIRPFTKVTPAKRSILTPAPASIPLPQQTQGVAHDNIAGRISGRNYFGFEAGITAASLTGGSLTLEFPYPYDDIGRGQIQDVGPVEDHSINVRYALAGVVDLAFSDMVSIQGKLGYRVLGSSGEDRRNFMCFAVATQRSDTATFNDEYSLSLGVISFDVLGRFQFVRDGFYGLAGFGTGGVVSASASASQTITSDNLCQYSYSSSPNALTGSFVSANDDIDLSDEVKSARFDLRGGVGTFIPVGDDGMMLVPELTVGIPLTSFLAKTTKKNEDLLSLPYVSLTIGLKFPWGPIPEGGSSPIEVQTITEDADAVRVRKLEETGKVDLSGRVLNKQDELIDDAAITVVDLSTNEVVATDRTENGEFTVEVTAPGRYSVTADAPGYLFGSTYYELDKDGRILRHNGDIRLSASADGRVRLLVFFEFDKANLQPSSYPELDRAVALMKANPSMEVEIAGFTDAQGADAYNKDLSQRRANSVLEYLVRKDIEKARIAAVGYGEGNPVSDNETESGRAENRRVEFVVKRR